MKKIILLFLLFFVGGVVFAQSFMQGAGLAVIGSYTKGKDLAAGGGITYSPRYNFYETGRLSVSVGIPVTIGISSTSNAKYDVPSASIKNEYSIGFLINVPVMVCLNMGNGSTKENSQKFGYFAGAGYGFHHGDFYGFYPSEFDPTYETFGSRSLNVHGPAANAGLRYGVGKKYKNIELKVSYMKVLNEKKQNIFGIALLYNF